MRILFGYPMKRYTRVEFGSHRLRNTQHGQRKAKPHQRHRYVETIGTYEYRRRFCSAIGMVFMISSRSSLAFHLRASIHTKCIIWKHVCLFSWCFSKRCWTLRRNLIFWDVKCGSILALIQWASSLVQRQEHLLLSTWGRSHIYSLELKSMHKTSEILGIWAKLIYLDGVWFLETNQTHNQSNISSRGRSMKSSFASAYGVLFRFVVSGSLDFGAGVTASSAVPVSCSPIPFTSLAPAVSQVFLAVLGFFFESPPPFPFPFPFPLFCFCSTLASLVAATRSLCACGVHGACFPKQRLRTSPGIPETGSLGAISKGALMKPKHCSICFPKRMSKGTTVKYHMT